MRANKTTRRKLLGLTLWLACAAYCCAQPAALAEAERAIYRGDFSRAAALAQSHLKTSPKSAAARVLLARARLAEGKAGEAYAELRRAVRDDPAHVDALYYLGTLAAVLSDSEFRQLYALAPDSARVHQLLAEAFHAQGNAAEAEAEYLAALKADPHSVESLTALGELKREQAKLDEAIDYYARAEQAGGLDYDIAYGLGACYSIKQEHARAVEYLRRAVAFAPDAAAARFALGQSLFQLGEAGAAVAELKAAVALEPKMRQAYFLLGRAEQKLGRREEAQAAFRKVDELAKQEFEADRGVTDAARPPAPAAGSPSPQAAPGRPKPLRRRPPR